MIALAYKPSTPIVAEQTPVRERSRDRWLIIGFALLSISFQFGLYKFGATPFRMPLRIGIFAVSLLFLVQVRGNGGVRHPASKLVAPIIGILAVNLINPDTKLLAGIAQVTVYIAVLAPLIWVSRLEVTWKTFRQLVILFWAFRVISASVGVLQIHYPGSFDGAMSNTLDESKVNMLADVSVNGMRLLRASGLSDSPGGAGVDATYAIILGIGLLLTERSATLRSLIIAGMVASIFSIFLSRARSNLVVAVVAILTSMLVLVRRGDHRRLAILLVVIAVVAVVGTVAAFSTGGSPLADRWNSLLEDDPGSVVYANRGHFLTDMLEYDVYKYPLGAGGGRWGMMSQYFGDDATALWAEMMWQAFLYDGGIPLIIVYIIFLLILLLISFQIALRCANDRISCWGAVLIGLNVANIAASFDYPILVKDIGLQMFMLNACLYAVALPYLGASRATSEMKIPNAISLTRSRLGPTPLQTFRSELTRRNR